MKTAHIRIFKLHLVKQVEIDSCLPQTSLPGSWGRRGSLADGSAMEEDAEQISLELCNCSSTCYIASYALG